MQALTLAMCPLSRIPFWGCRASSGHHNLFSTGPSGQWFIFYFFSASYAAIIFTGNRQNSEGNVNSYLFFVIIGLMYKSLQLHALNHKFPPRKHLGHYMFLGGQWVFWGASGFSDSLAPRASGCHSPMSRPAMIMQWILPIQMSDIICQHYHYNLMAFGMKEGGWRFVPAYGSRPRN